MSLILHLKSSVGVYQDAGATTPCASNGDPVKLWQDQSGNSNHFTQATPAFVPVYRESEINSGPVVRFDGAASHLLASNFSSADEGFLLAVLQIPSGGSSGALFCTADEAGLYKYHIMRINTGDPGRVDTDNRTASGSENRIQSTTAVALDTPIVLANGSDGSKFYLMCNGAPRIPYDTPTGTNNGDWFGTVPDRDNFCIGAFKRSSIGSYAEMDVAEIKLYDAWESISDVVNKMKVLMDSYNIGIDSEGIMMNLLRWEF